ncbi:MAG TPA: mechanosensitive ion channel family protein [Haliangium sp.]|nr:mechanosensitive ion channel family protein [Haliangium sp.]
MSTQTQILDYLETLWAYPYVRGAAVILGAILAAYLVEVIVCRSLLALTRRTRAHLDDKIIDSLRKPVFLSVILVGLAWASNMAVAEGMPRFIVHGCLRTLAVLIWTGAAARVGSAVLETLSVRAKQGALVQPRTLPLLDILLKVLIISGAIYFTFLAWEIDVTAWLASAGIIGIAVGFAAKDSLANLIAGIFILADAPYKVGDWVVLEGQLRGMVTSIGMRSTRILTRDDVEITVPNSVMGNSTIINEAGGPDIKQRVSAQVSVAYDSDIDHVDRVLRSCAENIAGRCEQPAPECRFRAFGASGLEFALYVWIVEPAVRDRVISDLNGRIFKRLREEGIEIPYDKHDVYVKELPAARPVAASVAAAGGPEARVPE